MDFMRISVFISTELAEKVTHGFIFHLRLAAFSSNFSNNREKINRVIVMVMAI